MPNLFIHVVNSEYASRDDGDDYTRPEDALAVGIRSATALVLDEINKGSANAAVEVRIEREDGFPLLRSLVSLSVTPVLPLGRIIEA